MTEMKRIDGLDIIKAVGIMMVISLHVPLWNPDFMQMKTVGVFIQYAGRLISPGVPLFLAVNGFLLLKREELDVKKHYMKVLKCLVLLLLWCVILALAGLLIYPQGKEFNIHNMLLIILGTQVNSEYTGVLWFLQFLIAVYLIYPILWYVYKSNYSMYMCLFAVTTFFSIGIASLRQFEHLLATQINAEYFSLFISFVERLNPIGNLWYTFYFMLGGVIWKNLELLQNRRKMCVSAGVIGWVIAVGYGMLISVLSGVTYDPSYTYGSVSMVLLIIGIFALVIPYESGNSLLERIILDIGQNTFGIYFIHYIFIFVVSRLWDYNEMNRFVYRMIAYIIVFVCSYGTSHIIKKIPYIKQIIEL